MNTAVAATLLLNPASNATAFRVTLFDSTMGAAYNVELVVGKEPSRVKYNLAEGSSC